jgi:hypothetical protein
MATAEHRFRPGDLLNDTYRIEALVGVGGTGEVYRAVNVHAQRVHAIKVLKPAFSQNEQFIELMRRELLTDVDSDATVKYTDLNFTREFGGLHFLVMEFIEGPSLAEEAARGPLSPETVLAIAKRTVAGLAAAHAAGVLHRDVAPDNIILRHGDPARATLIDFGIAKDLDPEKHTVIGQGFAGKYEFSAPEQMDGQTVPQSDLFALGVTLLVAARGRPIDLPSDLPSIRRAKDDPIDVSDQPEPLRGFLAGLLAPRLSERFASAEAAMQALSVSATAAVASRTAPRQAEPEAASPQAQRPSPAARKPGAGEPPRAKGPSLGPGVKAAPVSGSSERKGGRGGGIWVATAVLALIAGGAAFFFVGGGRELVFGPPVPVADPYRLSAELRADGGFSLSADAPDDVARAAFEAAARAVGGPGAVAEIRTARGAPSESWARGLSAAVAALSGLESWRLEVEGLEGAVEGVASDASSAEEIGRRAREAAARGGVTLSVSLESGLDWAQMEEVLSAFRDCGPLGVAGGRDAAAGSEDLRIEGRLADPAAAQDLRDALSRLAPGRRIAIDADILNQHVCRALSILRGESAERIEIRYSEGATGAPATGDEFAMNGNPVVDIATPAELTGFAHVFIFGSDGEAVPLLPNPVRTDNALQNLGTVEGGWRIIRVTWPNSEEDPTRPKVNFTTPGDNLVMAIVSKEPIELPMLNMLNVDEFAPALASGFAEASGAGEASFATRLLSAAEAER